MKTKHILGLFLVALSFTSFAQESRKDNPPTAEELASKRTKKMAKHLQLTDEQTESVHAVNLKMAEEKLAQRDQAKAQREEYKKEMAAILSADQLAKMEKGRKRMKEKMHKRKAKRKEKIEEAEY